MARQVKDRFATMLEAAWPRSSNILSPLIPPERDAELVRQYIEDPLHRFIQPFAKIRAGGEIIPLIANFAQNYLYSVVQERRRAGKPIRIIICKARHTGMSTFTEALLFSFVRLRRNSNAMVVAHLNDVAETVFDMTRLFHDQLPNWMRYPTSRRTKGLLRFENPDIATRGENPGLGSEMRIASAKGLNIGRGYSLRALHMSEVSSWITQEKTFNEIMQALEDAPETIAIMESTAQGSSDFFHDFWDDAVCGKGWIPVFLPWFIDDKYHDPITRDEAALLETKLSPKERDIMRICEKVTAQHLSSALEKRFFVMGKMQWRRRIIQDQCGGSATLADQEYPARASDAFAVTGESIFDLEAIEYYKEHLRRPPKMVGRLTKDKGVVKFVHDPVGLLKVWHLPEPHKRYVIGADASLGQRAQEQKLEQRRTRDTDYSAAEVMSQDRQQCAEYQDRNIDPAEFAEVIAMLGEFYNRALVLPEVGTNDVGGHGVLYRLREIYSPIGYWKKLDSANPGARSTSLGFEINGRSKPILLQEMMREVRRGADMAPIEHLGEWVNVPKLELYSKDLLKELSTFSLAYGGGFGAQKGSHDDLAIAFGLCLMALDDLPPLIERREEVAGAAEVWYPESGMPNDGDMYPAWASW